MTFLFAYINIKKRFDKSNIVGITYVQNHKNFNDPKHNVSMIINRTPIPSSSLHFRDDNFFQARQLCRNFAL